MIMKKLTALLLVLSICTFLTFASNTSRMYSQNDTEVRMVRNICIENGVFYPSVFPVTGEDLVRALEAIPEENRDDLFWDLYRQVESPEVLISDDYFAADVSVNINLTGYLHTGKEAEALLPAYRDIPPMAEATGEVYFGNTYMLLSFMEKDPVLSFPVNTNWSTLLDGRSTGFTQAYQPFEVGISTGNEYFNFQLGRNRQSFGRGITGNMVIGDNFSYQEYIRLSWTSSVFEYHLDVTHFDQQESANDFSSFRLNGMHNLRAMHNAAVRIGNRFEFRVYLGATFETDNPLDWRIVTPFTVYHSYNNFSESREIAPGDEANNLLGVELTYIPASGWKTGFQVVMDQLQLKYESTDSVPNAFGFLANAEYAARLGNGHIRIYGEAALTQPWLYLNYKYNKDGSQNFNYDHVYGYGYGTSSEMSYSGYSFGPDSLVLTMGCTFDTQTVNAGCSVLYYAHGDHGIGTSNPTLKDYSGSNNFLSPVMEQLLILSLEGSYALSAHVRLSCQFRQSFLSRTATMLSAGISLTF